MYLCCGKHDASESMVYKVGSATLAGSVKPWRYGTDGVATLASSTDSYQTCESWDLTLSPMLSPMHIFASCCRAGKTYPRAMVPPIQCVVAFVGRGMDRTIGNGSNNSGKQK